MADYLNEQPGQYREFRKDGDRAVEGPVIPLNVRRQVREGPWGGTDRWR
ncbi:hypothetical protein ACGF0D_27560 [Kitasatospora sp. NPDC048298]